MDSLDDLSPSISFDCQETEGVFLSLSLTFKGRVHDCLGSLSLFLLLTMLNMRSVYFFVSCTFEVRTAPTDL